MGQQATILDIPLFPLNTVLFPGMTLPLHIFEDRYKRMIAVCLEQGRSFGVVLIKSGAEVGGEAIPYDVGTVARIVQAVPMADGRYNILTQGAARFQVLESRYQSGYLTARVELLDEEELGAHPLREIRGRLDAGRRGRGGVAGSFRFDEGEAGARTIRQRLRMLIHGRALYHHPER